MNSLFSLFEGVYNSSVFRRIAILYREPQLQALLKTLSILTYLATLLTIISVVIYTLGYSFMYGYYFTGQSTGMYTLLALLTNPVPFNTYAISIIGTAFVGTIAFIIFTVLGNLPSKDLLEESEVRLVDEEAEFITKRILELWKEHEVSFTVEDNSSEAIAEFINKIVGSIKQENDSEKKLRASRFMKEHIKELVYTQYADELADTYEKKLIGKIREELGNFLIQGNHSADGGQEFQIKAPVPSDSLLENRIFERVLGNLEGKLSSELNGKIKRMLAVKRKSNHVVRIIHYGERLVAPLTAVTLLHLVIKVFFFGDNTSTLASLRIWIGPLGLALAVLWLFLIRKKTYSTISGTVTGFLVFSLLVKNFGTSTTNIASLMIAILISTAIMTGLDWLIRQRHTYWFINSANLSFAVQSIPIVFMGSIMVLSNFLTNPWVSLGVLVGSIICPFILVFFINKDFLGRFLDPATGPLFSWNRVAPVMFNRYKTFGYAILICMTFFVIAPTESLETGSTFRIVANTVPVDCIVFEQPKGIEMGQVVAEKNNTVYISTIDSVMVTIKSEDYKTRKPTSKELAEKVCTR